MDRPKGYEDFSGQPDWIEKTGLGGWHPDGSFNAKADYSHPDRFTRGVRRLVWLHRNDPSFTPALAVGLIEGHDLASMFRHLEQWRSLTEPRHWPGVQCSTSAEQSIKDAGLGIGTPEHLASTSPAF